MANFGCDLSRTCPPKLFYGRGPGLSVYPGQPGQQSLKMISGSKPVRSYPAGRRCTVCNCLLSIYNPGNTCGIHNG
jgi:hypothetical protein